MRAILLNKHIENQISSLRIGHYHYNDESGGADEVIKTSLTRKDTGHKAF